MELPTSNYQEKIDTSRFSPFKLQLGIDSTALETLYLRVTDAHQSFKSSPLAQVANQLEKEVVVSSKYICH